MAWIPGESLTSTVSASVPPGGIAPIPTGRTATPDSSRRTVPRQGSSVGFVIATMIRMLVGEAVPAAMSTARPPHSPVSPGTRRTEEDTTGCPLWGISIVKLDLVSSVQVRT